MKNRILTLFVLALLICTGSIAQRPDPIKNNQVIAENPNLKVDLSKIKIADTTDIKLNKLVSEFDIMKAENKNLKEDIALLKTTVASLSTKSSEIQKDNIALKLLLQGLDKNLTDLKKLKPVAFGVLVPTMDPVSNTTTYKLTNSYGITKEVYANYSNLVVNIDYNIVGDPLVITSRGENMYSGNDKYNPVNYSRTTDPKQFTFLIYPPAVYPISFIIYEIGK